MDDSFRVRVEKVFGSLGSGGTMPSPVTVSVTSPSTTPSASLWCLTDQEIERRQWNLHLNKYQDEATDDEGEEEGGEMTGKSGPLPSPPPSSLTTSTDQMMRDSDEEEEEEEEEEIEILHDKKEKQKQLLCSTTQRGIADEEVQDIESNIGRDCTLDFEEEEDEYDKVAAGAEEKSGDRIYMKDYVKFNSDYDTIHHELNTYRELPDSCQAVVRDPRANHTAARIRLKEDAEASGNFNALLQLSDNVSVPENNSNYCFDDSDNLPPEKGDENVANVEDNPKPILKKRGEIQMESSSGLLNKKKRVRFVMSGSNVHEEEQQQQLQLQPQPPSSSNNQLSSYGVPDYVKNPSKYTRYTLDDSNLDDQSNQKACMDFLTRRGEHISDDKATVDDSSSSTSVDDTSIPRSRVVFTPKREPGSTVVERSRCEEEKSGVEENRKVGSGSSSIGCTTMDTREEETDEICAMEEDTLASCIPASVDKVRSPQKPLHRQYRIRTNVDTEDNSLT